MRVRGIVFWLSAALAAVPVVADTTFPYRTTVELADAEVRSGPGDEHYATGKLAQGTTVEVYRRAKDRWCAIRPPEGSFSFVSARFVKKTDHPNLGTVTESDAPSRIGSAFGRQRHAVQVRLDVGESVEILSEQNNGGQTWYRIAPPAGEFRWIDRRFLTGGQEKAAREEAVREEAVREEAGARRILPLRADETPDNDSAYAVQSDSRYRATPLAPPDFQQQDDPTTAIEPKEKPAAPAPTAEPIAEPKVEPAAETIAEQTSSGRDRWHPAGVPAWREPAPESTALEHARDAAKGQSLDPTPATRHPSRKDGKERFGAGTDRDGNVPSRSDVDTNGDRAPFGPETEPGGSPPFGPSRDRFAEERDAIDFSLSHMVSGKPGTWRFDALRKRATALLAAAPTPGDRADVRQILARIARFDELQHRRAAISGRRRLATATPQHRGSSYRSSSGTAVWPRVAITQPPSTPAASVSSPSAGDRFVENLPVSSQTPPSSQGWTSSPQPSKPANRLAPGNRPSTNPVRQERDSQNQMALTPNPSREDGRARSGIGPNPSLENGGGEFRTESNSSVERRGARPGSRPQIDAPSREASVQASRQHGDVVQIPEDDEPLPDRSAQYDATGVLKRVGSRRREAPRFAVVDSTGDISSFITPSPGVNLQPFVGQLVGVFGTRGFMPEYRRPHVTAARVTPVDGISRTR